MKFQIALIVRAPKDSKIDDAEALYQFLMQHGLREALKNAGVEVVEHDAYQFTY
jgi:hypothetical protein